MGSILSSSVVSVGTGYSALQNIAVKQGTNKTAHIFIITVDGSGVPLTYLLPEVFANDPYRVTDRGCGYTVQNSVPTDNLGGGGSGFVVNILTVGPGSDGTHGVLANYTTTNTGSGYAVGDTGLFVQGGNNSATYRITTASGGHVAFLLRDFGDGYTLGVVVPTNGGSQPGIGSGYAITCTGTSQCSSGPLPSGFVIYSAPLI